MKTLQLSDEKAREIYPKAPAELKTIMEDTWSKEFFSLNITDRIKTVADVLAACGETEEQFNHRTQFDSEPQKAGKMIELIVKALNQGWEPDWNNYNEYKWWPWFYLDSPGFRLRGADCDHSSSDVGSRLCFKSEELAKYAGNNFQHIYQIWMA